MKLHELKPAEGSRFDVNVKDVVSDLVTVKLQVKVIKDKTLVQAVAFVLDLKVVKHHLFSRLPKRGFTNINRKDYAIVNLETLNRFEDGTEVTPALLIETGIISKEQSGVKILG